MASGVGFAAAKFAVLSSQARNPLTLIYRGKDRAKLVYTASVSGIYFRFKRFRVVPILLQKSCRFRWRDDFVALMRFATEAWR